MIGHITKLVTRVPSPWGIVEGEDKQTYCFREYNLSNCDFSELKNGMIVEFSEIFGKRGNRIAGNVTLVEKKKLRSIRRSMDTETRKELYQKIMKRYQFILSQGLNIKTERLYNYLESNGYGVENFGLDSQRQLFESLSEYFELFEKEDGTLELGPRDRTGIVKKPVDISLTEEQEEALYQMISKEYGERFQSYNCIVLSELSNLNPQIEEITGYRSSKALMQAAHSHFTLGYNQKNVLAVAMNDFPLVSEFSLEFRGTEASEAEQLKRMFRERKYEEALCSDLFGKMTPDAISPELMEMAVNAAKKILEGEDAREVSLNQYDKLLLGSTHTSSLSEYKENESLMDLGLQRCISVCDKNTFRKYYNTMCSSNSYNNSWAGIVKRFESSYHMLYLCFYVIAFCADKNPGFFDDYLKFVQNSGRIEQLPSLLRVFKRVCYPEQEIPVRLQTWIMALCLDTNRFELYQEAMPYLGLRKDAVEYRMVEWIDGDSVSVSEMASLLDGRKSMKAIEKYINYYWYQKQNDTALEETMLSILSSICLRYPISYFEEILYNNSYPSFTRGKKEMILKTSFPKILSALNENKSAYVLASFIVERLFDDAELSDSSWFDVQEQMLGEMLTALSQNADRLKSILTLFKLDKNNRMVIEKKYCEILDSKMSGILSDPQVAQTAIEEFEADGADFAVSHIVRRALERGMDLCQNREMAEKYFKSLKNMAAFGDALKFVKGSSQFSPENKKVMILELLYNHFTLFGVSETAYRIFDDSFPIELAENLALEKFVAKNGTPIILMAIYARKQDWLRVSYLYAIYNKLVRIGNAKFFNQLLSLNSTLGNSINHYRILKSAFAIYSSKELTDYLAWCRRIPVINSKEYVIPFDLFAFELKALLEDSQNGGRWKRLMRKISDMGLNRTAFGYSVTCQYLIRFALPKKNHAGSVEEIHRVYADEIARISEIFAFNKPADSQNLLSLNRELLAILPCAYWYKFYAFIERESSVLEVYRTTKPGDCQEFYDRMLEEFASQKDPVFLKIAAKIYELFRDCTLPRFDRYLPYTASSGEKGFLFRMLLSLAKEGRNEEEIGEFVNQNSWNCKDTDADALALLRVLFSKEESALPSDIRSLPAYLADRFRKDCAVMLCGYPEICGYEQLKESDSPLFYKLTVLQYLLRVSYDHAIYKDFAVNYETCLSAEPEKREQTTEAFLRYMNVCIEKHCAYNAQFGLEYISKRYIKLLLVRTALGEDRYEADKQMMDMMQNYHHTSLVYEQYYMPFKAAFFSFMDHHSLSEELERVLFFGLIDDDLTIFLDRILEDDWSGEAMRETACLLHKLIYKLAYPLFNQRLLYCYLTCSEEKKGRINAFSSHASPMVYKVICTLKEGKGADAVITEILMRMCQGKPKEVSNWFFNRLGEETYREYAEILAPAFCSVQYDYAIISKTGGMVRSGKSIVSHPACEQLFTLLDRLSVYWYLRAVEKAIAADMEETLYAYHRIGNKAEIPKQWVEELKALERYVSKASSAFIPRKMNTSFDALQEVVIRDISFISSEYTQNAGVSKQDARLALRTCSKVSNPIEERIQAAKLVLRYLERASDFYTLCDRRGEQEIAVSERVELWSTYNEFVFEYGLLLASTENREKSVDFKFDVLMELFDNFEVLNDLNKGKFQGRLKVCFADILSYDEVKGFLSYRKWVDFYHKIRENIFKFSLEIEDFGKLCSILERCVKAEADAEPAVSKLELFRSLLQSEYWGVSPYLLSFQKSLIQECKRLESGVLLGIEINNSEIEGNKIFYQIQNRGFLSVDLSGHDRGGIQIGVQIKLPDGDSRNYTEHCSGNVALLRPGYISGEFIELKPEVVRRLKHGDRLSVVLTVIVNGVAVCDNRAQLSEFIYQNTDEERIFEPRRGVQYRDKTLAFSKPGRNENIGFGRKNEREDIDAFVPLGFTIIYGPSRVGKSSLLNYIQNKFLPVYRETERLNSVTAIRVEEDYDELTAFSDGEAMERLFITSLIDGLEQNAREDGSMPSRMEDGEVPLRKDIREQVLRELKSENSIRAKLLNVSRCLRNADSEIWLLIDEFQQVVEKWKIGSSSGLASLCSAFKDDITNIKLVLCGSDDLVKIIELRNNEDIWWAVTKNADLIRISQLIDHDFYDMMKDRTIWEQEENIPYTEAALKAMYTYTGGNAIYGKIIGNKIIDRIRQNAFAGRKKIYPSDISSIMAEMLSEQLKDDLQDTNLIIKTITKNLGTEMRYLIYIAYQLKCHQNYTHVSRSSINAFFAHTDYEEIDLALKVVSARDVLSISEQDGEKCYAFSTMFYYDFFKELATEEELEKMKKSEGAAVPLQESSPKREITGAIEQVKHEFESLSPAEQRDLVASLYFAADEDMADVIRQRIGGGDVVHGDKVVGSSQKIGSQTNIQINAEQITSTLQGFLEGGLSGSHLLEAVENLPRLNTYYTPSDSSDLALEESKVDHAINTLVDTYSDGISPIFEEELSKQEDLWNVLGVEELLHISQEDFEEILDSLEELDSSYFEHLCFTLYLHRFFHQAGEGDDPTSQRIDYSPVAIMYCKLVEALLKEYHRLPYGKVFQKLRSNVRQFNRKLKRNCNLTYRELMLQNVPGKITIGTFSTPIAFWNEKIPENRRDGLLKEWNRWNPDDMEGFCKTKGIPIKTFRYLLEKESNLQLLGDYYLDEFEDSTYRQWRKHAEVLSLIGRIRNMSAHGEKGSLITRADEDRLVKYLFEEGELLRIKQLVEHSKH